MVHKITKEKYDAAGLEYRLETNDYTKQIFEDAVKNSNKPRRYKIVQIYRRKIVDKEYVLYNQIVIAEDSLENDKSHSEFVGMYGEPKFQYRFDQDEGRKRAVGVQSTETKYEIPATKENIEGILDGTYYDPPRQIEPHNTSFVLWDDSQKYSGFTRDEFVNMHFDDLLFKAHNGYYPRQLKPFGENKQENQTIRQSVDVMSKPVFQRNIPAEEEQYRKEQLASQGESRETQQMIESAQSDNVIKAQDYPKTKIEQPKKDLLVDALVIQEENEKPEVPETEQRPQTPPKGKKSKHKRA